MSDLPVPASGGGSGLPALSTAMMAPSATVNQATGLAVQSVATSTAVAIQDGSTYMRNVTTMASAAIGVALAQLVATKDAKWAEVIQHAQKAVSGAAQNFQQIGEASAAIMKAYPVGRS